MRSWFTISENLVYIKHSRPFYWQFLRLEKFDFVLLFTWKKNTMSVSCNKQLPIDYLQLRIAFLQLRDSSGGQTWNGGAQSLNGGQGTTVPPLSTAMWKAINTVENCGKLLLWVTWRVANYVQSTILKFKFEFKCRTFCGRYNIRNRFREE